MVGGNVHAYVQKRNTTKNSLAESVVTWCDVTNIIGWLDLSSGNSNKSTHRTKNEESTHVFICDYRVDIRELELTKHRFVINNRHYELKYIDDPMEIHDHLEITLRYVGVANV